MSTSFDPPASTASRDAVTLRSAALDAMPGSIAVLDARGVIVAVNRAWRESLGAEDDAAAGVGRRYFELFPVEEELAEAGGPSIPARLSALLAGGPGFEAVYACHVPDRPRWCRMSASPLEPPHRGAVVLHADVTAQVQSEIKLRQLANYDELTGVKRRRHFFERLEDTVRSARRYGHPLALAIADLDDLKPINDALGHAAGDRCLAAFASVLTGAVRATDLVGRYGGDEFVLAFPHTRAVDAAQCLERVRENLAHRVSATALPPFTATFGVVELGPEHADGAQLTAAADRALYRGKSLGRDRIEIAVPGAAATPRP
jgi:diguanylate cyclase (GGDEF)-like protein